MNNVTTFCMQDCNWLQLVAGQGECLKMDLPEHCLWGSKQQVGKEMDINVLQVLEETYGKVINSIVVKPVAVPCIDE